MTVEFTPGPDSPFRSKWLDASDEEFAAARAKGKAELTQFGASIAKGEATIGSLRLMLDKGTVQLYPPEQLAEDAIAQIKANSQYLAGLFYIIEQLWDAMAEMRAAHQAEGRPTA